MSMITFVTGRWGPSLSISLCGALTQQQTRSLIEPIALSLAEKHDHPMVAAVRSNMAGVMDTSLADPRLDQAVTALLRNTLTSYSDFFRLVSRDQEPSGLVEISTMAYRALTAHSKANRGVVLVGVHMCSFDLSLVAAAGLFPSVQALSKANPEGSSPIMNDIRTSYGVEMRPLSSGSLRKAMRSLHNGGVVAVAADLPLDDGEELVFFGRRARLGIGHARLALATGADLVVVVSHRIKGGRYRIEAEPVIRPVSTGNRKEDSVRLAQAALLRIERYIKKWPDEWFMPIPVWPEYERLSVV